MSSPDLIGRSSTPPRCAAEAQRHVSGEKVLAHLVLPNFYFHAATAYDILRHNGIEIGKRDFLGAR